MPVYADSENAIALLLGSSFFTQIFYAATMRFLILNYGNFGSYGNLGNPQLTFGRGSAALHRQRLDKQLRIVGNDPIHSHICGA